MDSEEVLLQRLENVAKYKIIVGFIPAEWELTTIVNCYKGKKDALERGNCRDLKLFERFIMESLMQQVDMYEMQFGFMSGRETEIVTRK